MSIDNFTENAILRYCYYNPISFSPRTLGLSEKKSLLLLLHKIKYSTFDKTHGKIWGDNLVHTMTYEGKIILINISV